MAEDFLSILAKEAESKVKNVPSNVGTDQNDFLSQLATDAETKIQKPIKEGVLEGTNAAIVKGLKRGFQDIISTGASGIGYLDQKIDEFLGGGGTERNKKFNERRSKEIKDFEKDIENNQLAGEIGRIGGQILTTAPMMPVKAINAIQGAVKALPSINVAGQQVAAPLINRLIGATAAGGIGGAVFGAATSGGNEKSLNENIAENSITGALAGPVLTSVVSGAGTLGNKLLGSVSNNAARLAERAKQLGIDITVPQMTSGKFLKKYDQISGQLPFSGAETQEAKQLSQFARAISRTFGEDTDELSSALLKSAKGKAGINYEKVAANTEMNMSQTLKQDILKVWNDAKEVLEPQEMEKLGKRILSIKDKIDPVTGKMTGEAWQAMRRINEPLSLLAKSNNNLGYFAKQLRNVMDAEFNRSAPANMQDLLKLTNKQYKSIKTIEKLVEGSTDGFIPPLRLMQAVMKAPGGKSGAGKLGEIADIGRQFLRMPSDSGTPQGILVNKLLSPATTLAATVQAYGTLPALIHPLESATIIASNPLIRKGLNSKSLRDAVINQSKGKTYGATKRLADVVAPYSNILAKPINPLKITVNRPEE